VPNAALMAVYKTLEVVVGSVTVTGVDAISDLVHERAKANKHPQAINRKNLII
jgi:hypothetical protein